MLRGAGIVIPHTWTRARAHEAIEIKTSPIDSKGGFDCSRSLWPCSLAWESGGRIDHREAGVGCVSGIPKFPWVTGIGGIGATEMLTIG